MWAYTCSRTGWCGEFSDFNVTTMIDSCDGVHIIGRRGNWMQLYSHEANGASMWRAQQSLIDIHVACAFEVYGGKLTASITEKLADLLI
jgi:hypothetical protein